LAGVGAKDAVPGAAPGIQGDARPQLGEHARHWPGGGLAPGLYQSAELLHPAGALICLFAV